MEQWKLDSHKHAPPRRITRALSSIHPIVKRKKGGTNAI